MLFAKYLYLCYYIFQSDFPKYRSSCPGAKTTRDKPHGKKETATGSEIESFFVDQDRIAKDYDETLQD